MQAIIENNKAVAIQYLKDRFKESARAKALEMKLKALENAIAKERQEKDQMKLQMEIKKSKGVKSSTDLEDLLKKCNIEVSSVLKNQQAIIEEEYQTLFKDEVEDYIKRIWV